MRNYFVRDLRAARAGFRQIHGVQLENAIALEHIERVAERADHGVIAHAIDFIETGDNGQGSTQRPPIAAAEVAVDAEGENPACRIGCAEAKAFYNAFHFLS